MSDRRTLDKIYDLSYQYTQGEHTMGYCSNGDCPAPARGGLYCKNCAEQKLADVIGARYAGILARLFNDRLVAQQQIDSITKEVCK